MKITKKKIIIAVILIIAMGIGLWFWYSSKAPRTILVEETMVENVTVRETVSASGIVAAENSSDLNFLNSGTITRINVSEGDSVKPGQILAALDSYTVSQSAKASRDARDIALRNRDLFIEQYADEKELIGGDGEFQIRLRTLNEQISQAEATYKSQTGTLANLNMKAPFAGTVIDILKRSGEAVSATETVIKLADLNDIYFELDLDQEDFGKVSLDDSAEVELDAYPDEIFYGRVKELPVYVNSANDGSQLKIKVTMNLKEGKSILLGMAGDGTIVINQSSETVMALPFDAVFTEDDGRTYIWILNKGTMNKKYIQTGIIGDIYTEVIDNLEGQTIVIPSDSSQEVKEGDKGKITK